MRFLGQTIMLMDTEYLVTFITKNNNKNKTKQNKKQNKTKQGFYISQREQNHLANAYRAFCDYFRYNNFNKERKWFL